MSHNVEEHTTSLPSYEGFEFNQPIDLAVKSREVDRYFIQELQAAHVDTHVRKLDGDLVLVLEAAVTQVQGVYDLLLSGDGRLYVQNLLQSALGQPRYDQESSQGTFLRQVDAKDIAWELYEASADGRLCPCVSVPDECRPVLRLAELKRFVFEGLGAGDVCKGPPQEPGGGLYLEGALRTLGALLEVSGHSQQKWALDIEALAILGCGKRTVEEYFAAANRAVKKARQRT